MLIDTSGFFAQHDRAEAHFKQANQLYSNSKYRITTNYILSEYVALATIRGFSRQKAIAFSMEILIDKTVEIVWVNDLQHMQAVELLKDRRDKAYSLCDAVSFVVMREKGVSEALTTDKHFEQEGFLRLLP